MTGAPDPMLPSPGRPKREVKASMQTINILSIERISAEDRAKIEAVDPRIQLTDAGGWYDGEIRETWPAFASARYLAPGATGAGSREDRHWFR